jgi:hypothetical protein
VNQFLKSIGSFALGVAGFVAIIAVIFLLVQGGAWMADKVYPILIVLFLLALVITVLILLPLAIFRKTAASLASVFISRHMSTDSPCGFGVFSSLIRFGAALASSSAFS